MIDLREPSEEMLDWLSTLLHTTDSAYPIGGFAHSGGLEGMVALGQVRTADDLRLFMHREIAETLGNVELPLLFQAWIGATVEDAGVLQLLDQVSESVRFAAEQRQASRRLGAQRFALLMKLHAPRLDDAERA
jgi:urease accessory protein